MGVFSKTKGGGQILNDSWDWIPDYTDWLDSYPNRKVVEVVEAALHAHSRGLAAYLCFMGERLVEMHRVLKDTGSIYLHCDPTASHYLKAMLDAVFGEANFRNEIAWCYSNAGRNKKQFCKKHDIILFYSKSENWHFDYKVPVYCPKTYNQTDKSGRRYHKKVDAKSGKEYRYYEDEGATCLDWWTEFKPLGSRAKNRVLANLWTTQKPVPLYERIILASTKPGDLVLDPFCGCATTCIAAENNNRQWVGIEESKAITNALTSYLREATKTDNIFVSTKVYRTPPRRTDGGNGLRKTPGPKPRKVNISKELWNAQRDRLSIRHGKKCQGCFLKMPTLSHLELDHIIPKARYLEWNPDAPDEVINHPSNLTLLCSPCNRIKGARHSLNELRQLLKSNTSKASFPDKLL